MTYGAIALVKVGTDAAGKGFGPPSAGGSGGSLRRHQRNAATERSCSWQYWICVIADLCHCGTCLCQNRPRRLNDFNGFCAMQYLL